MFKKKAVAIILRERNDFFQFLAHSFVAQPELPWRFPGGGIHKGESIEQGLLREVYEECGLTNLTVLRKLGVKRYFKVYSKRFIARHDYVLLAPSDTPDSWEHTVHGDGSDAGEVFRFHWLGVEDI